MLVLLFNKCILSISDGSDALRGVRMPWCTEQARVHGHGADGNNDIKQARIGR